MYTEINKVSEEVIASLRWLLEEAEWSKGNAEYYRWNPGQEKLGDILGRELEHTSFFLMIPPKGYVHIHRDNQKPYDTFHIPVYTNPKALCYVEQAVFHLPVGKMFHVERTRLHWSVNFGDTERVHLLLAL